MLVVSYIDFYKSLLNQKSFKKNYIAKQIFFNEDVKHLVSKRYLDFIEDAIPDKDILQALLKELYDEDRLETVSSNKHSKSLKEEFEYLSATKSPIVFSIAFDNDSFHAPERISIKSECKKLDSSWVSFELLQKSVFTVDYSDFASDIDIANFFSNIFNVPKYIRKVLIFDREICSVYKNKLKGKKIYYYTLYKGRIYELRAEKQTLRASMGGSLKLFSTPNPRILHERKIIFENIVLTVDNAFENLTIKEPTWQITVAYSPRTSMNWTAKCSSFREIY